MKRDECGLINYTVDINICPFIETLTTNRPLRYAGTATDVSTNMWVNVSGAANQKFVEKYWTCKVQLTLLHLYGNKMLLA